MLLLGLAGRKQAGKNTAASFAAEWAKARGGVARNYAFADKLKWALLRTFIPDIPQEPAVMLADELKESDGSRFILISRGKQLANISCREGFQHFGTEAGRDVLGNNIWIDAVMNELPYDSDTLITISDVRFPNEVEAILARNGKILKIERPDVPHTGDPHLSEVPLPPECIWSTLYNIGSLEQFKKMMFSFCEELVDMNGS